MKKYDLQKKYMISLDDDPSIHKIIQQITGTTCIPFKSADKLTEKAKSYTPSAVFIDIHLDVGVCGLDFIPRLRSIWNYAPIFVITSDIDSSLIGTALASGANDFLRKPLIPEELLGRLHARTNEIDIRREDEEVNAFDLIFNKYFKTLSKNNRTSYLPNIECKLFSTLIESGGVALSRDTIKSRLWGKTKVSENTLDKKVSSLRKILEEVASDLKVKAIYGSGIKLVMNDKK